MLTSNSTRRARGTLSRIVVCGALATGCPASDEDTSSGSAEGNESSAGPTTDSTSVTATGTSTGGATDSADTTDASTSSGSSATGDTDSGDSSTGEVVCGDPAELGVFTPSDGNARGFEVVGDTVYLAVESAGIAIVDITDPTMPVEISTLDLDPGQLVQRIAVGDGTVFVGLRGAGWSAIDVSDPTMPNVIFHEPNIAGQDLAFADGTLYVADVNGVQVFDVSDPAAPVALTDVGLPGSTQSVVVAGDFAYATGIAAGLSVLDISDPAATNEVTTLDFDGRGYLAISGDRAFLSASDGVHIVDITDPTQPAELGLFAASRSQAVAADDRLWMLSDDTSGRDPSLLTLINYDDPALPVEVFAGFDAFDAPSWVEVSEGRVLFSEENDDPLHILDGCPQ